MKKLDLVKLKNDKPYREYNLIRDIQGIVVNIKQNSADIMFFNP